MTWGEANGWHHHSHVLLFLDSPVPAGGERELHDLWYGACKSEGLSVGTNALALTTSREKVEEYVTKAARPARAEPEELALWHYKTGKAGRFTPFDLARGCSEAKTAGDGDATARFAGLFRECVDAYKGRARLRWSPGLRKRLGLKEQATDVEVANEERDDAQVLYVSGPREWREVRKGGNRWLLRDAADAGGFEAFKALLDDLLGPGWFDPVGAGSDSGDSAAEGYA